MICFLDNHRISTYRIIAGIFQGRIFHRGGGGGGGGCIYIFHGFHAKGPVPSSRTLKSRKSTNESWVWSIRVQLAASCALKKASLLSSPGGPLSRPRHVPSSFIASVRGKPCYCPMHLMPDVETSIV